MKTKTITFVPQNWTGHRCKDLVEAEPKGAVTFEVPVEDIANASPRSESADFLKDHKNAPEWVREWDGPYELDWEDA